jgi:succinoglycan biosynthesis protein ExoM
VSVTETIDICICTFKRPQIAETIASIGAQQLPPDIRLRLVVADNEPLPAARDTAERAAQAANLPLTYVHAPAANISIARNACLDAASSDWGAFVDDDECARPDWIARLLAHREGVDVVFGISQAVYPEGAPSWLSAGDFHSNRIGPRDQIHNGYTCNVLLRRRFFADKAIRFDLAMGKSGGEDTVFFDSARIAGARFAYAPDAVVTEAIPAHRATLNWLLKRRFRAGQTDFDLRRRRGSGVALQGVAAVAKVAYCFGRAGLAIPRPHRAAGHLLRGTLHVGYLASLFGKSIYEEYKEAPVKRPDR